MMSAENLPPNATLDPVAVVTRHLREGEDVVRCAAAGALGAIGDNRAAPALVDALLDEDPDVRVDAMAALVHCARPEDADAIRRSLMGDPVKETKVFAIRALSRLADAASVPLLCALAKERCDHDIAWEDDTGMWDEWLDVQVEAIKALGEMDASEAIDTLLEARSDELGQELDTVVFKALAEISNGGVPVLASLLHDQSAAVRTAAFLALSKARKDVLIPLKELFAKDASADVRCLAIGCLDATDPLASRLALADPDATVRRAALKVFAYQRPEIAQAALGDSDEMARAIALEALVSGREPLITDDLIANVLVWIEDSDTHLTSTCAKLLPTICGVEARGPLCALAMDEERSVEARIAALCALAAVPSSEAVVETLKNATMNPIRQLRTAALASLASFSKTPDIPLVAHINGVLVGAILGDLLPFDTSGDGRADVSQMIDGSHDADGAASQHIVISPDGEIVAADTPLKRAETKHDPDSNVIEGNFPQSTLEALQGQAQVSFMPASIPIPPDDDEGTQEEKEEIDDLGAGHSKSRRRRVAVDGPEDIGADLRLVAIGIAADCPDRSIEQALLAALDSPQTGLRVAAFKALAQRSEHLPLAAEAEPLIVSGLEDTDPIVRALAVQIVAHSFPGAIDRLSPRLDDTDAIVRSTALKYLAASVPERMFAGLRDESLLVRRVAVESVTAFGDAADLENAIEICLEEGRVDSLIEACRQAVTAQDALLAALNDRDVKRRKAQTALEAIAAGCCQTNANSSQFADR